MHAARWTYSNYGHLSIVTFMIENDYFLLRLLLRVENWADKIRKERSIIHFLLLLSRFFSSCNKSANSNESILHCKICKTLPKLPFIERKPSTQKFERPNGKNTKSKKFLKSVQNLCPLSHLKALCSEFFEDLNRIKTNQNKWKSMTFLIILHLKPKTLLY